MEAILNFIFDLVRFALALVIVPVILLGVFGLALKIATGPSNDDDEKASKLLAFWLGLVLFALVVILHLFSNVFVVPQVETGWGSPFWFLLIGLVTGLALMAAIDSFMAPKAAPVFVTVLASTSLIAFYFYAFIEAFRGAILFFTVALLAGALGYAVFSPKVVRTLFPTLRRTPRPK